MTAGLIGAARKQFYVYIYSVFQVIATDFLRNIVGDRNKPRYRVMRVGIGNRHVEKRSPLNNFDRYLSADFYTFWSIHKRRNQRRSKDIDKRRTTDVFRRRHVVHRRRSELTSQKKKLQNNRRFIYKSNGL